MFFKLFNKKEADKVTKRAREVMKDVIEENNNAFLPDHLKESSEVEGYQRIANSFYDRGENVQWGPNGPYIEIGTGDKKYKMNISSSFMYPTVFNFKEKL